MGLSFLTPALLGGAALVAVPIVLHLAMRRRPVPHAFPALRFLQQRAVANRRRLRLRHLLLLLVRMAALALLALALARPVLKGAGWLADTEAPVAAAFVFDTAPRMALREGNRSRLEQATALARVLFGKLPAGSAVAVLDTSGQPAAFAPSPAAAEARIGRLAVAAPGQSLPGAIAVARRLLAGAEQPRRELYIFTDCSRGAWEQSDAREERDDDGTRVLFVDVAAATPRDFAIESIALSSDQVAAGTTVGITAMLARTGPDESRPVAVEILMPDGRYARRAVKPVEWKESGTPTIDFDIAGLEPGTRQGRVVIDGSDDLPADDTRSFTVVVGAPAGVIVAAPAPAERSALFLAQALAPAALVRAGQARFALDVVPYDRFDTADWNTARGIVMLDPPPLAAGTWDALGRWVAAGRGLVIWLGPRAGSPEAFNSPEARRVLGGRLVRVWRTPVGDNYLAPTSLDHPLLAAFRRVGDAVPWQDFPVLRHWEFMPDEPDAPDAAAAPPAPAAGNVAPAPSADATAGQGQAAGTTIPVATFRNGLPALLERRIGRGTVIIATTPVSQSTDEPDVWNTLATGFEPWPFVILANEMLLHAIDTAAERNILAGTAAVVPLDRRDVATAFVRTPAGDDFPVAVDQQRGSVTVSATQEPGNYRVLVGGREGGVETGFSVNLDPAATDFRRLAPEELAAVLGPGARLARTEDELVRDVALDRIGAELFGWIILLAALAMAGDWIVANRFYAPRDEEAGRAAADFKADLLSAAPETQSGVRVSASPVPPVPPAPPVPPPFVRSPPPVPRAGPPPLPELGA